MIKGSQKNFDSHVKSYWEKAMSTMGVTNLPEPIMNEKSQFSAYIDITDSFQIYYNPYVIIKNEHYFGVFLHEIGHYLFFPFDATIHFRTLLMLEEKYGDSISQSNIALINNICQDLFIDYVIYKRKYQDYNLFLEDFHKENTADDYHSYSNYNALFNLYMDLKFSIHGLRTNGKSTIAHKIRNIFDHYLYNSRDFINVIIKVAKIFVEEVKKYALQEQRYERGKSNSMNNYYDSHGDDEEEEREDTDSNENSFGAYDRFGNKNVGNSSYNDDEDEYDEDEYDEDEYDEDEYDDSSEKEILDQFLSYNNDVQNPFYPTQKFEITEQNYQEFIETIPEDCSYEIFEHHFVEFFGGDEKECKKRYYNIKATKFLIKNTYYSSKPPLIKIGVKKWEMSDSIADLDIIKTKSRSPNIWLNAKKREKIEDKKNPKAFNKSYPDLLIALDTSGSMSDEQLEMAVTCGYGLTKLAKKTKRKVATINFSYFSIVQEWTRNEEKILENLTLNQEQGTQLPIEEIKKLIKSPLRQEKDSLLIIIITDGGISDDDRENIEEIERMLKKNDKVIIFLIDGYRRVFEEKEHLIIHDIKDIEDLKNKTIDYAKKSYGIEKK